MYRRLNRRSDFWVAGILSAIFLCLVVALGGAGGSARIAVPAIAPSHSGGLDVSHQPSGRFLLNHNRHLAAAPKLDEMSGLDDGEGPDPAIAPDEIALFQSTAGKPFVAGARHAPDGDETRGYDARAPPASI